jgi:hypothetical protein
VRDIGHGDINAGREVLRRFVARLRSEVIPQPDGNDGHIVGRGR